MSSRAENSPRLDPSMNCFREPNSFSDSASSCKNTPHTQKHTMIGQLTMTFDTGLIKRYTTNVEMLLNLLTDQTDFYSLTKPFATEALPIHG